MTSGAYQEWGTTSRTHSTSRGRGTRPSPTIAGASPSNKVLMRLIKVEYLLSVLFALLAIGGAVVWTQASGGRGPAQLVCGPDRAAPPAYFKGMSVYRCPGGKRG